MEPCILDHFVVHRTTACVACVKEQSLCIFKIKEKHSPVYYSAQLFWGQYKDRHKEDDTENVVSFIQEDFFSHEHDGVFQHLL